MQPLFMKLNWWLCASALSAFLWSCGPKFPGYTLVGEDVYRQLITLGNGDQTASGADFVFIRYSMETKEGKELESGQRWLHKPDSSAFGIPAVSGMILGLYPGDSIHVLAQWKNIKTGFWENASQMSDTSWVCLRIGFSDMATDAEFAARYRSFWLEPEEEDLLLADYLLKITNAEYKFRGGIYFRKIETGKGDTLRQGNEVMLGCRGSFLNGEIFDDTYRGRHLWVTYGRPDQLIPGLQKAVWSACAGDSIEAIVPSYLAFGPQGSSSGIVPPYTPVRYHLRIIEVAAGADVADK